MPIIRRQPLLTAVVGSHPTDGPPRRRAIQRADCGLRELPREVARATLARMVAATRELRAGL